MLTLTCPYCGIRTDETELSPGCEVHLKRLGPIPLALAFTIWCFKQARFIDESVAAGVAH
jgi:sarcosine oxidase, subunit delta